MAMNPRLLRPLATGFNPKSIAGLVGWWDASDATTVTLNGSDVSQWRDKSGSARHLNQTDASLQPAYATASENGLNAVLWPSTTNSRTMQAASSMTVQQYFVACNPDLVADGALRGFLSGIGEIDLLIQGAAWFSTSGFNNISINGGTEGSLASNPPPNTRCIIRARTGTAGTRSLRLGTDRTNASRGFWGSFCEVLAFSASLSAPQAAAVEKYLSRKWGITLV
jgi:hypothetical protein